MLVLTDTRWWPGKPVLHPWLSTSWFRLGFDSSLHLSLRLYFQPEPAQEIKKQTLDTPRDPLSVLLNQVPNLGTVDIGFDHVCWGVGVLLALASTH